MSILPHHLYYCLTGSSLWHNMFHRSFRSRITALGSFLGCKFKSHFTTSQKDNEEVNVVSKLVRTSLNVLLRRHSCNYLSLYAPITSDECHPWFHLNAAIPAAMNTEQVSITTKTLFIVRFEPSHGKETSLEVQRLNRSANSQLVWMKKLNVHLMPVYMYSFTIYK